MVNSSLPGFKHSGEEPPQWAEIKSSFEAGDLERTNELEIQVWIDGARRAPEQVDRITSYNVCYTKLLRDVVTTIVAVTE